jgi:hypothetical protein
MTMTTRTLAMRGAAVALAFAAGLSAGGAAGAQTAGASVTAIPQAAPDAQAALRAYLDANRLLFDGQSDLARALGLTGAAAQAHQAAGALDAASWPPASAVLSRAGGAQQSVALALSQAFANDGAGPAPADAAAFREGLTLLARGVDGLASLQPDLDAAASRERKAHALAVAARNAPDQRDTGVATLRDAVRFAARHGIAVPAGASATLGRMP